MSASSTAHPGAPKAGTLIAGKYRVGEVLGKGGMGVVVAAEHTVLRQRVAVKLLLPISAALPGAVERFMREARAASAVQSEHVARVIDAGVMEDGVPFIVMEHLTGSDMGAVIKARGALPVAEATDLVLQACEAIAEAHARGIIHRDLKPSNLFLTSRPDGSPFVKVMDFGLSKLVAPGDGEKIEGSITETSVVLGSPHYMSPEQFRSFKRVDARTDIWALGVILYVLLTGKKPFDGESFAGICMSIASDTPEPARDLRPDLPVEYEQIVMRCLEKKRDRRVQSVAELARAIAPFGTQAAAASLRSIEKVALPSSKAAPPAAPPGEAVPDDLPTAVARPAAPAASAPAAPEVETARAFASSPDLTPPRRRPSAAVIVGAAALAVGVALAIGWARAPDPRPASSGGSPPAAGEAPAAPSSEAPSPPARETALPEVASAPPVADPTATTAPVPPPTTASAPPAAGSASAPAKPRASSPVGASAPVSASAASQAPPRSYDRNDLTF